MNRLQRASYFVPATGWFKAINEGNPAGPHSRLLDRMRVPSSQRTQKNNGIYEVNDSLVDLCEQTLFLGCHLVETGLLAKGIYEVAKFALENIFNYITS